MALEYDDWIERVFGTRMPMAPDKSSAASARGATTGGGLAAGLLAAGGGCHVPMAPVPRVGINHHLTPAVMAARPQTAAYRRALPQQWEAEQANLVRLTGWNPAEVCAAMQPERDGVP